MNPKELLCAGVDFAANVVLAGIAGALVYGVISSMPRKPHPIHITRKTRWIPATPEPPMLSYWQGPPFYFSREALDGYRAN